MQIIGYDMDKNQIIAEYCKKRRTESEYLA